MRTEYAIHLSRTASVPFQVVAARVQHLPGSWGRVLAVATIAEEWSRRDPRAVAAWIEKLPASPGPTVVAYGGDAESLYPISMQPSYGDDGGHPLDNARLFATAWLSRSWAAMDALAACRWASALPDPAERLDAMMAVGDGWSDRDPAAVLHYASAHPDERWRDSWIRSAAFTLAKQNPEAATAAALLLPPDDRATALSYVFHERGRTEPREATVDLVRAMATFGLEERSRFDWALSNLVQRWTQEDPATARTWAGSLDDPRLREIVLGIVGAVWAEADPRSALAWARQLPPGEGRAATVASAVTTLAPTDLETARALALGLDAGDLRHRSLVVIGHVWGETSPVAALSWARALPTEDDRTTCIRAVLTAWAEADPEAARTAAEPLENLLKLDVLARVEGSLVRRQREALRERLLKP
jgi:hypothetical protein